MIAILKQKKALVIQSGGMDSALCLALAIKKWGADSVLSLSFNYQQRHSLELDHAKKITHDWNIDHVILDISCLNQITENALTRNQIPISHSTHEEAPNTLVVGRNGLMARLGAIHAHSLGSHEIYLGVIGVEAANSGYRDCSRDYMDKMEAILRIDLEDPDFKILTPLVHLNKTETMELGDQLGVLNYLLENTLTCYEGVPQEGCKRCPACKLRNEGILAYFKANPNKTKPSYFFKLA